MTFYDIRSDVHKTNSTAQRDNCGGTRGRGRSVEESGVVLDGEKGEPSRVESAYERRIRRSGKGREGSVDNGAQRSGETTMTAELQASRQAQEEANIFPLHSS